MITLIFKVIEVEFFGPYSHHGNVVFGCISSSFASLALCLLCHLNLSLTVRSPHTTTPSEWNPSGGLSATNFSLFPDLEGPSPVANYDSCTDKTFQYIFVTSQSKPFKAFATLKELEYPLIVFRGPGLTFSWIYDTDSLALFSHQILSVIFAGFKIISVKSFLVLMQQRARQF